MTTKTRTPDLLHARGCPAERIEHPHEHRPDVVRCVDCGAHYPPTPAAVGPLATAVREVDGGVTMVSL